MVIEPEMLHIPAGPFTMGTSDGQVDWLAERIDLAAVWREKGFFGREQPQHGLTLPGYHMARHPVIVKEYRAFVEAGGYQQQRHWTRAGWDWRTRERRVRTVSRGMNDPAFTDNDLGFRCARDG